MHWVGFSRVLDVQGCSVGQRSMGGLALAWVRDVRVCSVGECIGWASLGCWTFRDVLWVNALGGRASGVVGPLVNALGGWGSVGVLDVPVCSVGECLGWVGFSRVLDVQGCSVGECIGWVGFSRGAERRGLFCG